MDRTLTDEAEVDRLLAENLGPYLRTYLAVRLAERGEPPSAVEAALEDVYAGLLACGAFVHGGETRGVFTRVYGLVDLALPHLLRPALRRPVDPELAARARRFAALVAEQWHGAHQEHLAALQALSPREREAVLLREFHALSMHEIGQRLGLEREAARALVTAARSRGRSA
jgi:DNA-binding CsgD family transcriptional regulator